MSMAYSLLSKYYEMHRSANYAPDEHEAILIGMDSGKESKARRAMYAALRSKYGDPIDSGRGRAVFAGSGEGGKNYVIKMGWNRGGDKMNRDEAFRFQYDKASGRFAECRLVKVGRYPVLIMRRLQDIQFDKEKPEGLPDWTSAVDTHQVGTRIDKRTGEKSIRAYDYSDAEPRARWEK